MDELATPALLEPFVLYRGGFQELVFGTSPAAGADYTEDIGGRFWTRLLSVHAKLVCSADVANRELVLEYRNDQGLRFALAGAEVAVAASQTGVYEFNRHIAEPVWPVDGSVMIPLPAMLLRPTYTFRLHIVNAAATDQLSEIRYVAERFYSDNIS